MFYGRYLLHLRVRTWN